MSASCNESDHIIVKKRKRENWKRGLHNCGVRARARARARVRAPVRVRTRVRMRACVRVRVRVKLLYIWVTCRGTNGGLSCPISPCDELPPALLFILFSTSAWLQHQSIKEMGVNTFVRDPRRVLHPAPEGAGCKTQLRSQSLAPFCDRGAMLQCTVYSHRLQLHDRVALRVHHAFCELHHLHRACPCACIARNITKTKGSIRKCSTSCNLLATMYAWCGEVYTSLQYVRFHCTNMPTRAASTSTSTRKQGAQRGRDGPAVLHGLPTLQREHT